MDISESGAAQQKEEKSLNLETHFVDCSDGIIQDAGPSSTPAENSANNSALQDDVRRSLIDQANDVAKEVREFKVQMKKMIADFEAAYRKRKEFIKHERAAAKKLNQQLEAMDETYKGLSKMVSNTVTSVLENDA
ncbi:Hypothetical predicted protein [Cloeon dipterum]|uniref:Uncharacterized protein n=1 Tax=Cloeon dipterum TaxID=197152 RepID=A0A8S1DD64_9INSE|nr:Hypothetical predicted protein [Cloeon dipterum]